MKQPWAKFMLPLAVIIAMQRAARVTTNAYNTPACADWPSESEWDDLRKALTGGSRLNGPFRNPSVDYSTACYFRGQSNVELLKGGDGLCMSKHSCANQFCQPFEHTAIPAYSIQAESISDIQVALAFANTHNIGVSVKSSGHSYHAASMGANTLLIWMRHFPHGNVVTENFQDTCGVGHGKTLRVAGGQNFDDTLQAVRDQYHIVTGLCQTVALGGGWLLGGGLSVTSRYYGYGLDQVRSFQVILADGTLVTADACTNSDLFWALRGGGAGFGIVTSLEYQLYDVTKITVLTFDGGKDRTFMKSFLGFILPQLLTLDRRWAGFLSGWGPQMYFVGSLVEAANSDFVVAMDKWYASLTTKPDFKLPSSLLVEHKSWFDAMGGDEAYENPDFDGTASSDFSRDTFSRVLPRAIFEDHMDETIEFLTTLYADGDIDTIAAYILGGATEDVPPTATSIHPAMRQALLEIETNNPAAMWKVKLFLSGYETSVCYNHHSPEEPDWKDACFGTNYDRLLELKTRYDPNHLFNVYHGVGYQGPVFGETGGEDLHQTCNDDKPDSLFFISTLFNGFTKYFCRGSC